MQYHQHVSVQVDEPALREGLPLKQDRWGSYLAWAVDSFRLSTAVAAPHTQIVTHLCYSDFQDILKVSNRTCICSIGVPTLLANRCHQAMGS